jgi:hypothetical protein
MVDQEPQLQLPPETERLAIPMPRGVIDPSSPTKGSRTHKSLKQSPRNGSVRSGDNGSAKDMDALEAMR